MSPVDTCFEQTQFSFLVRKARLIRFKNIENLQKKCLDYKQKIFLHCENRLEDPTPNYDKN